MNISYIVRAVLLGFLIVMVAACGSNKKKDLEPLDLESFDAEIKIEKLWSKKIGDGLGEYYHQFSLAVDAKAIYAASQDGKVYKLDKLKGRKSWKTSIDTDLTTGVAVDSRHVYIGAVDGTIIALKKNTGEQSWTASLGSEIVSPPTIASNHLVVQTVSGEVYNLDAATGEQRWQYDSNMPALTLRGNSRAIFFAEFIAVGLANGKLAVLDLETGQLRWDPKVATAKGETEIERMVDVDGTPVFFQDKLYAVSYQGQIVAYELKTGRLLWAEEESSYRDVTIGFGNVYVSSENASVTAYDQQSGEIKWVNENLLRRKITAPSTVSSYLAIADYKGYLHLLSQIDGHLVARKRVSWSGIKTNILADGTRFYAIANNGKLRAYELGKEIK